MSDIAAPERSLVSRPEVPNEFRGLARDFRYRLAQAAVADVAALDALVQPLKARALKGKFRPRQDVIIDTARAWRERTNPLPRLALEIDVGKSSLNIRDLRISSAVNSFEGWPPGESEPAIAILLTHLETDEGTFWFRDVLLAGISLHALARRYQRGFGTSDEALKRDFLAIARASISDDLLGLRNDFRIPSPTGGIWVGAGSITAEGTGHQRILSVRSFISE